MDWSSILQPILDNAVPLAVGGVVAVLGYLLGKAKAYVESTPAEWDDNLYFTAKEALRDLLTEETDVSVNGGPKAPTPVDEE